jgi:urea transport system ATP-binding protein
MLRIDALEAGYGESLILRGVSLHVPPAAVLCLMGRNGVGKTTLLKSVMGILRARSGRVTFDGHDITTAPPEARADLGIGYVPQGREIFPHLTVAENLRVGLLGRPAGSRTVPEHVFELFPKLHDLRSRKGGVLSGGEQQQLALARVLCRQPRLLLLDEPTEGIQPSVIDQVEAVIARIKKTVAILLVEQYLEFAWRLADSFAVMQKGVIVSHGATEELRPETVRQHLTV